MFTMGTMAHPFLSIFMTCKREKEQEKYDKVEYLPGDVRGFNYKHRGMSMMKSITFIVVCCFVLILRNDEWNELIGHPNDREKNWPNSRTNSLQQWENDADCVAINFFKKKISKPTLCCYFIRVWVLRVFISLFY